MNAHDPIVRLAAMFGFAAILAACAAPVTPPPVLGMGSVIGVRALDVIGNLDIHRGPGGADLLEGTAAERTMCPCSGVEYVVRLDSGATAIVAQELKPAQLPFSLGARVTIQTRGGERTIFPAPGV